MMGKRRRAHTDKVGSLKFLLANGWLRPGPGISSWRLRIEVAGVVVTWMVA